MYEWFTRNCLSCRDAARLVSESCERKLTVAERVKLLMLQTMCPYTHRYVTQIRQLHDHAASFAELEEVEVEAASHGLTEACRTELKRQMRLAQAGENKPA